MSPLVDLRSQVSLPQTSPIAGRALLWSVVVHCGAALPFLLAVSPPIALPQKPVIAVEIIGGASLPEGIAGASVRPAPPQTPASAVRQPVAEVRNERLLEVAEVESTPATLDIWDDVPVADDAALLVPQRKQPKVKLAVKTTAKKPAEKTPEPPLPKPKPQLAARPQQEVPPQPVETEQPGTIREYEKAFGAQAVTFAHANLRAVESGAGSDGGAGDHETNPKYGDVGLANQLPPYPYKARKNGQQGRVILRVAVSSLGGVDSIEVLNSSGYRLLDRAARAAVQQWRFQPATRAGIAVAGFVDIPVTFRLNAD